MIFEAAKCPSCGAAIQVPSANESARCMYCGSVLVVKEAIQMLNVELNGDPLGESFKNDLAHGQHCLEASDWKTAYAVFRRALEKRSDSDEAWIGCLTAMTQKFSWIDQSWVSLQGVHGLDSTIKNCCRYADFDQKKQLSEQLERLYAKMGAVEQKTFENNQRIYETRKKNNRQVLITGGLMSSGFLVIFMSLLVPNGPVGDMGFIGLGLIGTIGLIVLFFGLISIPRSVSNLSQLRDQSLIRYLVTLYDGIQLCNRPYDR